MAIRRNKTKIQHTRFRLYLFGFHLQFRKLLYIFRKLYTQNINSDMGLENAPNYIDSAFILNKDATANHSLTK